MTQSSTARILSQAIFMGILNSRQTLTPAHIGSQVLLFIQGSGTFQSATEQEAKTPGQAQYFDKYIYNLKANSQEAMSRKENRIILSEAIKAESAGDVAKASELFNQYLNAVQVSFNVIADRGHRFENGDQVSAIVEETDTKAGYKAIVVNNVRYKKPTAVEKMKFDLTDLIAEEEIKAPELDPSKVKTA
jgi:hypothetical protein